MTEHLTRTKLLRHFAGCDIVYSSIYLLIFLEENSGGNTTIRNVGNLSAHTLHILDRKKVIFTVILSQIHKVRVVAELP